MRTFITFALAAVACAGILIAAGASDVALAAGPLAPVAGGGLHDVGLHLLAAGLLGAPMARGALAMPVLMAPRTIDELLDERQELVDASQSIMDAADDAGEDISADDLAAIEENQKKVEALDRQIKLRQQAAAQAEPPAGPGRRSAPEPRDPPAASAPQPGGSTRGARVPANARDGRGGFDRMGNFAQAVHAASRGDDGAVARLTAAATTFGSEGVGADGGFLVPPEFRRNIWQRVMEQENLLTRCDPVEIDGNNITVPKDDTAPWDTSNGIQVYWESEGSAATQTKPKFDELTMRLQKLLALVPVTEELLSDAPGLESWLRRKAPQKMAAKINTAIVRGTGVGQPLGILNAPCLVSVAKESSQPADSVYFANINKMWSRMYAPCRRNAVWLINQDIEPQLDAMAFDPDATSKTPVYLPAGGLSDSPYARMKGRPVVPIEACSTLGDQGDIILGDMTQYMTLLKAGQDIRTDVSMHLYFDQALQCFRFIFRVNGQPSWGSTLTPENGSATRSCFVTLDERG